MSHYKKFMRTVEDGYYGRLYYYNDRQAIMFLEVDIQAVSEPYAAKYYVVTFNSDRTSYNIRIYQNGVFVEQVLDCYLPHSILKVIIGEVGIHAVYRKRFLRYIYEGSTKNCYRSIVNASILARNESLRGSPYMFIDIDGGINYRADTMSVILKEGIHNTSVRLQWDNYNKYMLMTE